MAAPLLGVSGIDCVLCNVHMSHSYAATHSPPALRLLCFNAHWRTPGLTDVHSLSLTLGLASWSPARMQPWFEEPLAAALLATQVWSGAAGGRPLVLQGPLGGDQAAAAQVRSPCALCQQAGAGGRVLQVRHTPRAVQGMILCAITEGRGGGGVGPEQGPSAILRIRGTLKRFLSLFWTERCCKTRSTTA